jgi:hypothetical protein
MTHRRSSRFGVGEEIDGSSAVRLLAVANPVAEGTLRSAQLAVAFERVGERIMESALDDRSRRSSRRFVAVAFVAISLVAAAAALGAMLTTHTGFFPKVAGTENDTSEFLRTDARDFPPLVAKLVKDIPFPPGVSATANVGRYVEEKQPGADGVPETVQAAGIKGTFSLWAICAWRGYWLQAHTQGDSGKETAAVNGVRQVASSDALKKVDSFWPHYLALAQNEADGSTVEPAGLRNFYVANCARLPKAWAGR